MIPGVSEFDYPELFAVERHRLLQDLASLAPQDWQRQSPCPGWDVLGLVVHLVGDDLSLLARGRDHHTFGDGPPLAEHEFIGWLDALQDQWVATAVKRMSPRIARQLLEWSGSQVVEHQRSQDPASRSAMVSWASREAVPVWLDQARDVSEYWIHRQQLRQSVGWEIDDRGDVFVPVLHALSWAYPFRLQAVEADDGDTVEISVSGRHPVEWVFTAGGGSWSYAGVSEDGQHVIARVAMSSDVAWRCLTNNLPDHRRSEMEAWGDPRVIDAILSCRAIIGSPHWPAHDATPGFRT